MGRQPDQTRSEHLSTEPRFYMPRSALEDEFETSPFVSVREYSAGDNGRLFSSLMSGQGESPRQKRWTSVVIQPSPPQNRIRFLTRNIRIIRGSERAHTHTHTNTPTHTHPHTHTHTQGFNGAVTVIRGDIRALIKALGFVFFVLIV